MLLSWIVEYSGAGFVRRDIRGCTCSFKTFLLDQMGSFKEQSLKYEFNLDRFLYMTSLFDISALQ